MRYPISISHDLKRNPYKGLYIALEGIDGCGKSTQVQRLATYFKSKGKNVVITSEPMKKGPIQELIRNVLSSKIKIPSRAYQDLYSADRSVNHEEIVQPALERGDVVIAHRSFWSAAAYGILDLGNDYSFEKHAWPIFASQGIFSGYHKFLAPDKTFYLKVSARLAAQRLSEMDKEKDVYEKAEKLAKIVHGYDTLDEKFPEEFIVIDGEQSEEKVTEQIISKL